MTIPVEFSGYRISSKIPAPLIFGTLWAKFKFSLQSSARSFDFLNTYSSKMWNFGAAKHVFQITEPSSKRSRISDFFQKLPSNPAISTPEYPAFLRCFRPIDALRRPRGVFALVDQVPNFRRRLPTKLPCHQQLMKTTLLRRIKEVLTNRTACVRN